MAGSVAARTPATHRPKEPCAIGCCHGPPDRDRGEPPETGASRGFVSTASFQDAMLQGVERAHKTLKNVVGAWVKDQEVTIDKCQVTGYRVILKVTVVLSD
jgi:flavin-binding protein dodecin